MSCKSKNYLREKLKKIHQGERVEDLHLKKLYNEIKEKSLEFCILSLRKKDKKSSLKEIIYLCLDIKEDEKEKDIYNFIYHTNEFYLKKIFSEDFSNEKDLEKKFDLFKENIHKKNKFYEKNFTKEKIYFDLNIIDYSDLEFILGKISYKKMLYKKGFFLYMVKDDDFKDSYFQNEESVLRFIRVKKKIFTVSSFVKKDIAEKEIFNDFNLFLQKSSQKTFDSFLFIKKNYYLPYDEIFHFLYSIDEITEKEYKMYKDKSLKDLEKNGESLFHAFHKIFFHNDKESKEIFLRIFYDLRGELFPLDEVLSFLKNNQILEASELATFFLIPYPEYSLNFNVIKSFFVKFFKKILQRKS